MSIRQLIINLLVLNIVLSNFAWAIDECAYDFSNSDAIEFLISSDQSVGNPSSDKDSDNNSSSTVSCDSHCFANVRLVYIAFDLTDIPFLNNHSTINSRQVLWHSVNAQPPVKPPRV